MQTVDNDKAVKQLDKIIKKLKKEIKKNLGTEDNDKHEKGKYKKKNHHGRKENYHNHSRKEKISTEDAWMLIGIIEKIKI